MARPGAKPKLTEGERFWAIRAVLKGASLEDVARAYGVSSKTIQRLCCAAGVADCRFRPHSRERLERMERGRRLSAMTRPVNPYTAKLRAEATELRLRGLSQRAIASELGFSQRYICGLLRDAAESELSAT